MTNVNSDAVDAEAVCLTPRKGMVGGGLFRGAAGSKNRYLSLIHL